MGKINSDGSLNVGDRLADLLKKAVKCRGPARVAPGRHHRCRTAPYCTACVYAMLMQCIYVRMLVCMLCTYACTHVCGHAPVRMHACAHACMRASMRARMRAWAHACVRACVRVRLHACVRLPQEEILSCERRDPRDPVNNADWNLGTVERGGFQLYSSMQSEAEPHAARRRSVGSSPGADVELAWAHPAHVCTATAPTAATSAFGASRSTQGYSRGNAGYSKGTQRILQGCAGRTVLPLGQRRVRREGVEGGRQEDARPRRHLVHRHDGR
jgi:hypothetical protein